MASRVSQPRPSASGRRCTRSSCSEIATHTLIYVYADSTAVIGPLATSAEPHTFDLCLRHSEGFTVPKGWTVIQHSPTDSQVEPSIADLDAIADAVRKVATTEPTPRPNTPEVGRRGHLRAIPNSD